MISLFQLTSEDLKKLLVLAEQREALQLELETILAGCEIRSPKPSLPRIIPRQPLLNEMISGILQESDRPMTVREIYEASLEKGYVWRSGSPINALNVKMYTDTLFKKTSPGHFVLRKKKA